MTVVIVERVTPALRGLMTRWMLEVHAGVFIGTLSARVRSKLWEVVCDRKRAGVCTMAHRSPNEQGFVLSTHGEGSRTVLDFDGLQLLAKPTVENRKPKTPRSHIARIAAEAGVDARTVASLLAGKEVRPTIAERIQSAADKLGIDIAHDDKEDRDP
jgi:CRISPR-associated protein Cas2